MQVIQALLVMMALSSIIFASFATSESRGTWQITHLLASACGLMLTFVQQTRLDDYARLMTHSPISPSTHPRTTQPNSRRSSARWFVRISIPTLRWSGRLGRRH